MASFRWFLMPSQQTSPTADLNVLPVNLPIQSWIFNPYSTTLLPSMAFSTSYPPLQHRFQSLFRRSACISCIDHRDWLTHELIETNLIFTGPRCPRGPVYGSRCLSLPTSKSFLKLYWCDSGWWWYQLNTIDDANINQLNWFNWLQWLQCVF